MTTATLSTGKDWTAAFTALRHLLGNPGDTAQVFRIMRALNAGSAKTGYDRLLRTAQGGRIAWQRPELAQRFADPAYVARFAPGTVGAAYAAFLADTGYSAQGLAAVSRTDDDALEAQHPYAWFGRRIRDTHDIWHLLTGYSADDPLGEACLTAFSYAQTGGLGWAVIAVGAALKSLRLPDGRKAARAIWQGYRNGRRAAWLAGEDYDALLAEPIADARRRLNVAEPTAYLACAGLPRFA
jgi:ubiquinone biosynthesis protein COQ4